MTATGPRISAPREGNNYVVVQWDGSETLQELWNAETRDGSSQRTGPSMFDFNGDGRSEVIYGDEWYLRIYPGTEPDCPDGPNCDGIMTNEEVLLIDINSSRTRSKNPHRCRRRWRLQSRDGALL